MHLFFISTVWLRLNKGTLGTVSESVDYSSTFAIVSRVTVCK